ncbi:MAG: metallophosphoesterase [Candidatus Bathyarchaeota archaeon]
MIIGIISDTHDNLPMIEAAVNKLNELNVELVYHAGDYIAPFVDSKLRNLKAPLIGVLGNNDGSTHFYDILITGHTHEAKIYRKGQMLVINPGETCGLLTGKSTIAILDTDKLEAEIIELKK